MPDYPSHNELVLVTIRKIMPYGAVCTLNEYNDMEAFIHVSEIASGWVRNIRMHLKEGQQKVGQVLRVDPSKQQVDISLKRVRESDKKKKIKEYQTTIRARKIIEHTASSRKERIASVEAKVIKPLEQAYGSLANAMAEIAEGKEKAFAETGIPEDWQRELIAICEQQTEEKTAEMKMRLKIRTLAGNGAEEIRDFLGGIRTNTKALKVTIHYVGAPDYLLYIEAPDYKKGEKVVEKIEAQLEKLKKEDKTMECSLERVK